MAKPARCFDPACRQLMQPPAGRYCPDCWARIMAAYQKTKERLT